MYACRVNCCRCLAKEELTMICNLGSLDRAIRITMGVAFLAVGYFGEFPKWLGGGAYAMGFYAFLSGAVGFCPVCKVFGINTCGIGR